MRTRWLLPLLALSLLALAVAPCRSDGSPPHTGSGIEGIVTIGPTCSVERVDSPCPDRPYQATIVVQDDAGHEVTRASSGKDGRFSIELTPGRYTLVARSPNGVMPPHASDQTVDVLAGAYTAVTIQFDSGIR